MQPGARKTRLALQPAECKVFLQEHAVDGRANAALIEVLSDWLGVPRSHLALVRGHTCRDKIVAVEGLGEAEVHARLQRHAEAE